MIDVSNKSFLAHNKTVCAEMTCCVAPVLPSCTISPFTAGAGGACAAAVAVTVLTCCLCAARADCRPVQRHAGVLMFDIMATVAKIHYSKNRTETLHKSLLVLTWGSPRPI